MNSRETINAKVEGIFQQVREGKPPVEAPLVSLTASMKKIKGIKYTSYVREGHFHYELQVTTERQHRNFLARVWREDEEKMSYDELAALFIMLSTNELAPFQAAQCREPHTSNREDRLEQIANLQKQYVRNKLPGMRENPHRIERMIPNGIPLKKSIVYFAYEIVQGA